MGSYAHPWDAHPERRNMDQVIERGESSRGSLTAVGFTQWRPHPSPLSQRHFGRVVRHIHKQHLLSFSLFLRSIGRWWLLYVVDKKRHCIWSVTGNTLKLTQGRTSEATLPFIPGAAAWSGQVLHLTVPSLELHTTTFPSWWQEKMCLLQRWHYQNCHLMAGRST